MKILGGVVEPSEGEIRIDGAEHVSLTVAGGVAVIFISHGLKEVEQCADRVVVLRDGAVVGELAQGDIAHDAMIRMMIGRDLKSLYIQPERASGAAVLEIAGLRTPAHAGY